MRKYYWYITGYLRKHGSVLLGSIIVAIIIFSVLIPRFVTLLEQKDTTYIGVVGSFTLQDLPEQVSELTSAGLTIIHDDGTVSPGIAERWIIEDDGTTYRFVLKKELLWQDGKALVPLDFEYNFKDVTVVTTPNEIVFKLPEPFVPFPSVVSEPVYRYQTVKKNFFEEQQLPIGIGSYQIVDYQEENDGSLSELVVESPLEKRVYRTYLTEEDAVIAFKHGKVDQLSDFSNRYDISDWNSTITTETIRNDRYVAVFFNNANPLFSENIRQALSYALIKPNDQTRAIGPINPDSWVYLESGKTYDYDLDRALERLFSQLPPEQLTFELTTTANFLALAEDVKQQWESFGETAFERCQTNDDISNKEDCQKVNIAVNIRVSNFPDTDNFQSLLVAQQIPNDPDQYYLWHSEQMTNFTGYKNTRIDALLERGRTTAEAEERKAIYQEFQQFFLEDAPAAFIAHVKSYDIARK